MIDPLTGTDRRDDIVFHDGELSIRDSGAADVPHATIDGSNLLLTPGFMDLHVHFREPGNVDAEDIDSGCACAARGGFTSVVTMPNTVPPVDSPEAVRAQIDASNGVRILPSACITRSRNGESVADLHALASAGAVAFTDDGETVANDGILAEAMQQAAALDKVIMDHAVDPSRARSGVIRDSALARRFALPVFPVEAELAAVERDIELARREGCALHLQHLSCAGSVELLAKASAPGDFPISAEVTPHHLALSVDALSAPDPVYKMNPPLGTNEDRAALRQAVLAGIIPCFATDHAPHSASAKNTDFTQAAFGVIGLETAAAVTFECMVEQEGMPLTNWVAAWTIKPAGIIGQPLPSLRFNAPADFALFRISDPQTITAQDLVSKSRNCPFIGFSSRLSPAMTCRDGRILWQDTRRLNPCSGSRFR